MSEELRTMDVSKLRKTVATVELPVTVTRYGKPVFVAVSPDEIERLQADRDHWKAEADRFGSALVWIYRNGFRHSSECPADVQHAFSDAFAPTRAEKAEAEAEALHLRCGLEEEGSILRHTCADGAPPVLTANSEPSAWTCRTCGAEFASAGGKIVGGTCPNGRPTCPLEPTP